MMAEDESLIQEAPSQRSSMSQSQSESQPPEPSPPLSRPHGRKNVRQACESCRASKRRCDGLQPCGACRRYDNDCHYAANPRKKYRGFKITQILDDQMDLSFGTYQTLPSRTVAATSVPAEPSNLHPSPDAARATLTGMDSRSLPGESTLAWNVGVRHEIRRQLPQVTQVVSQNEVERLCSSYVQMIHPILGFIDLQELRFRVDMRWTSPERFDLYDAVICGVAVLGSLFSGESAYESALVDCAKMHLDHLTLMGTPKFEHVAGWILRTLYLRMTARPHAAWIASCTTMHIIEATGADKDEGASLGEERVVDSEAATSLECRRRQFWVATMMNTWMSFDCNRSKIDLRGATCKTPAFQPGDFTTELLSLYRLSAIFDIEDAEDQTELEDFLRRVVLFIPHHDTVALDRSHLVICIYRRLRHFSTTISSEARSGIISANLNGLRAAKRLADDGQPWWYLASVPFQFLCVLLAMDTTESLAEVSTAMETLETVYQRFRTASMEETLKTARALVRMKQKRKERDEGHLSGNLAAQHSSRASFKSHLPLREDDRSRRASISSSRAGDLSDSDDSNLNDFNFSWDNMDWDMFLGAPGRLLY